MNESVAPRQRARKSGTPERQHPRNPWIGLAIGVGFLLAACAGAVALWFLADRAFARDISGQRSEGFVILTPFIMGAIGIGTLIRGFRAIRPWVLYQRTTARDQRRRDRASDGRGQKIVVPLLFGAGALAGSLVLGLLARPSPHPGPIALLIEVQALLVLTWTAIFGLIAQTLYFRQFDRVDEAAERGTL